MAAEREPKVKFPLWPFLHQPLFHPTFRVMLNPARFQRAYQLRLLERCWYKQSPRPINKDLPRL